MEKKYHKLFKGKRVEFPLATGAATYVSLTYDEKKNPYLLCWSYMHQEEPEFTVPLKGCRIINNITEIGSCIHIITANEEYQFQCRSKEEFNEMSHFFNMLDFPILGFKNVYVLNKKIGKGSFSNVYIGTNILYGNRVVVKEVDKSKVKESNVYTEIEVLRKIMHKYIIKLISAYEQEGYVYLVLEYLKGGELFEYINNNGPYSEQLAKKAMKRVLIALEALHSNGVVHRDLKMENLMLENVNDPSSLKIIDFGLASFLNSPSMSMRCGSPGYVAPEILRYSSYGTKVDIFSLGVILYNILCGYPPFRGNNVKEIFKKNMRCHISFNTKHWLTKSENVKEIILWMCSKNPDDRCTAIQALGHPWFLPKLTDMHMSSNMNELANKDVIMQKTAEYDMCKKCKHYPIENNEKGNNNNDIIQNNKNCINDYKKYHDTMLKIDEKYSENTAKAKPSIDSISLNKKKYDMHYITNSNEYETVVLHGGYTSQNYGPSSAPHNNLKKKIMN
ncbi:CAMK protein kinase [Plasmodium yoelii 17X]|uniref:Protein kinase 2 n=4 Tax=Plasmodium yoelii TaxID=5861 RepID=A0AAE9WZQ6_PLAYO|nr:serine/threonine-protein kinase 2 [Plasmodium yoelii]EAA18495.1 probable serine/threonine-protein kinase 2 [Plasmodium yoelii yoelii]ETB61927.1 CAMK protein kinase [Plasmodium yoelii 17X]WBY61194.1 protein kinase 2 [Plasmodium yoelii yoelii]CDU20903.1 protein kinase 2 [Plasmodium yoelii]VTZ81869.1 protein kinase 2 [Plasmodium yoelii]|eukprot:XP_726930.1 serine/threonine-protein kinase 2 [Plasmodium yoelii]